MAWRGRFSCSRYQYCGLYSDLGDKGYVPRLGGTIRFTPDDESGAITTIGPGPESGGTRNVVDYINFGYWLYTPEDLKDESAWDFGLFAGGGDPFDPGASRPHSESILQALTGRADYARRRGRNLGLGAESRPFQRRCCAHRELRKRDRVGIDHRDRVGIRAGGRRHQPH